jgi:hypothetical protein
MYKDKRQNSGFWAEGRGQELAGKEYRRASCDNGPFWMMEFFFLGFKIYFNENTFSSTLNKNYFLKGI